MSNSRLFLVGVTVLMGLVALPSPASSPQAAGAAEQAAATAAEGPLGSRELTTALHCWRQGFTSRNRPHDPEWTPATFTEAYCADHGWFRPGI